jgi:hypothetical protein
MSGTIRQTPPNPIVLCGGIETETIGTELVRVVEAHQPEFVRKSHQGRLRWYGCSCCPEPRHEGGWRRMWLAKGFEQHVQAAVVATLFQVPADGRLSDPMDTDTKEGGR